MSKDPLTHDEILAFCEAVYPANGALAMTAFNEGTLIRDATETILALRARVAELEGEKDSCSGKLGAKSKRRRANKGET